MSNQILEIEFKGRRKEYAANPQEFPFQCGDPAIVSTDRGHDLGKISYLGQRPGIEASGELPLTVIRKATADDLTKLSQHREKEKDARKIARRKIQDHALEMKLVDVETQWDGRKMTFYFTAEGRVDFRDLVKDLASTFRTRIDLRQIGARDETRKTAGYGICGRPLCCATFLTEFKPITTQMPRDQFLPLNPSKLSGVCGRLKCCLRYELDVYREFQRNCPKVGHPVKDEVKGEGVIDKLDVIREEVHVRYSSGGFDKYKRDEFVEISDWKPQMPKNECICTCGRNGSTVAAIPLAEEEEDLRPLASSGHRVTIGEKGMSVEHEEEGTSVSVQTDVSAPSSPGKQKKRRGRHKKKPGADRAAEPVARPQAQQERRAEHRAERPQKPSPKPEQPSDAGKQHEQSDAAKKRRRRGGRRTRRSPSDE